MDPLFRDRYEAGRQLAARLTHLAHRPDVLVLGLPRGGVPVAYEVARALDAPLDVLLVRKLGLPGQEELAMGAIASGGIRVINSEVVDTLGIRPEILDRVAERELAELVRREEVYRPGRRAPVLHGHVVVLVDDGLATGSTMLAAVRAVRRQSPSTVVVAAPVASRQAWALLRPAADAMECVSLPEPFFGVGAWYEDFTQTTDEDVRSLLERAAAERLAAHRAAGHV